VTALGTEEEALTMRNGVDTTQRETVVQRLAERDALLVEKSRDRVGVCAGNFRVIDPNRRRVIAGGAPWAYSMTLEDVERYFAD